MTVKIYDYADRISKIDLPVQSAEEIDLILVNVKSGDETGFIKLKNGEVIPFDASDCRSMTFDDGSYVLNNDELIKKWLDYKPSGKWTASYERQELFY